MTFMHAANRDDLSDTRSLLVAGIVDRRHRTNIFNFPPCAVTGMSLETEVDCPSCEEARSFYRTAAMNLHLGKKTKWRCPECGYGFIRINGMSTLPA